MLITGQHSGKMINIHAWTNNHLLTISDQSPVNHPSSSSTITTTITTIIIIASPKLVACQWISPSKVQAQHG